MGVFTPGSCSPATTAFELPKMQRRVFEWLSSGKRETAFMLLLHLALTDHDDSKKTDTFLADLDPIAPVTSATAPHSPTSSHHSTPEADDSILTMDNNIPCSCDNPTLQTIQTMAGHWGKGWEWEDTWNVTYKEVLAHAQANGEQETTRFLDDSGKHALEGRMLLDDIRDLVYTNCPCCREQLKHDTILLHDLLVSITSQVKFFEVKVDSFCL
ncbi:uncharacterized protein F5891DRAFT_1196791 [Suillus fuscotomentosus]|uniref:Uncharacterized protein n=1 Tax=Suillus fuscotomentosus TaxID=1912939 RepID=A0AAD4DSS7_9AGAM|nr:uncharacterized protein F5891DRAFT_1196791 [Suillus fuscotomentosus]KAG1893161.1 hypothetical protein F5891DRAFT_1196791 [Suillus fuscotomentosus]